MNDKTNLPKIYRVFSPNKKEYIYRGYLEQLPLMVILDRNLQLSFLDTGLIWEKLVGFLPLSGDMLFVGDIIETKNMVCIIQEDILIQEFFEKFKSPVSIIGNVNIQIK